MTGGFGNRVDGRRTGWQLYLFDRPVAPPRDSRGAAERDALDMGHASRCELTGRVFVTVPASIEIIFL